MEENTTFTYNYSAAENKELMEIRKKYMPQEESKLDELKRLDRTVQSAGMTEALSAGVAGCLIFGVGMCMGMQVIGGGMVLGCAVGLVGALSMLAAYPIYRRLMAKKKEELTPRILQLVEEIG